MSHCLIGLGSNQGNREELLRLAVAQLAANPQVRLLRQSCLHETPAVGGPPDQPAFLNAAALLSTSLSPPAVLDLLGRIEDDLGRVRQQRWGPRTIDLDLLLFDEQVIETPSLIVPHARMVWRRFVLEPAAEIAASMRHPTVGWTIGQLLDHLNTARPYVAIAGGIGAGKSQLAERFAREAPARLIAEVTDAARLGTFYADPGSHAWQTEIEFLDSRRRLLAADACDFTHLAVSDFWFDQSLAFSRVWLPEAEFASFRRRWETARREVVPPKLLVLLDVPGEELHRRVGSRGRPYEGRLSVEQLDRLRQSVRAEAARPGVGPVLRLLRPDPEEALRELTAAVASMQ